MAFATKTYITYFEFLSWQERVDFASLHLALRMYHYFIPLG